MTRDSTKVCATPGCPELRPCPKPGHTPKPWAGGRAKSTLPADWEQRRHRVFARDGHRCTNCGHHDPTGRTLECDHIGDRLDHDLTNLTTLCGRGSPRNCHGEKTKQQAAAGRRRRRR